MDSKIISENSYKYVFNKSLEETSKFIDSQIEDDGTCSVVYNILQSKLKVNRDSSIEEVMEKLKPYEDKLNERKQKTSLNKSLNVWRPPCNALDHLEKPLKHSIQHQNDENVDPEINENLLKNLTKHL